MADGDFNHHHAAVSLRDAYTTGTIPPLRNFLDPKDMDGAYAIQDLNTLHWLDAGRRIAGYKIGLTSRSIQRQLGVDSPDYGVLFTDMQIGDGDELSTSRVIQPVVEGEIAIVLGRDLDSDRPTAADVRAAARGAAVAIELADSRIADWNISFADTIADNGSAAFFVLGRDLRPLDGLDLWSCGMVLEVDGAVASVGAGAACLGDPLASVVWLAQALRERGRMLRAGDIVLTGALGPPIRVQGGERIKTTIAGLGCCGLTIR